MTIEEPEVPGRLAGFVEDIIASALSVVPVVGGLIEPHYMRAAGAGAAASLAVWQQEVTRTLNAVVAQLGADEVENRLSSRSTAAALLTTTGAAMRDPQTEKLELLGNALRSTLLNVEPDSDLRHRFLSLVERHSVTDIRLLKVLRDPLTAGIAAEEGRADFPLLQEYIYAALPPLRPAGRPKNHSLTDNDLLTQYGRGLEREGLIAVWNPSSQRPEALPALSDKRIKWKFTTDLGDRYLNFLGQRETY